MIGVVDYKSSLKITNSFHAVYAFFNPVTPIILCVSYKIMGVTIFVKKNSKTTLKNGGPNTSARHHT